MTTQEKSDSETQKDGESSEKDVIPKTSTDHRLWIGNLDSRFREFNLLKMVEKFGPLAEFDFLYHRSGPQNGQPRGYAFVTYKDLDAARKAQKTLDGLEVFGRKLAVKWAHAQDENSDVRSSLKTFPATNSWKTFKRYQTIIEILIFLVETKYINKTKAVPPILSMPKEPSTCNTSKKLSKEKKIAALEEQLKLLEQKSGEMSFTPDLGVSSKPTSVIYNYIEQKQKTGTSHGRVSGTNKYSSSSVRPYKKIRRK